MRVARTSDAANLRQGFAVRLEPRGQERVRQISDAEHRSVSAYLERLVEGDLAARDEAESGVRVFVAPLGRLFRGEVAREAGERPACKAATLDRLFGAGR